jgi:hypothetical protein
MAIGQHFYSALTFGLPVGLQDWQFCTGWDSPAIGPRMEFQAISHHQRIQFWNRWRITTAAVFINSNTTNSTTMPAAASD